jgi:hypothetical protein
MLTPLELIERLAALIPPPRRHRHRYYGVLAPNAPLRSAVTPRWRVRRPRRPQPRHRLRWRLYPHPLHRAHQPSRHKQQKSRSIAGRRDTPGPCCLRASVRSSHCCARSVAPRSASSPSSTRRWPCARSSRAWASPPQRRLWRQPGARRYRRCRMPGRTDSTPRPSQVPDYEFDKRIAW